MSESSETYMTIDQLCRDFTISRSKFYRLLADKDNGLAELPIRIPPVTGSIRIPRRAFIAWARGRSA